MAGSARGPMSGTGGQAPTVDLLSRCVLFVTVEAGAAAFLAPLWRRWLDAGSPEWRVLAAPAARRIIEEQALPGLPLLPAPDDGADFSPEIFPDDWRPEAFFISASGAALEQQICAYGLREARPVLQFVDAPYNYHERFCRDDKTQLPDRILVIDERCVAEAVDAGLPAERIFSVGHPAWETVRPLPPADARHVMYVDQPVERFYGGRLGYTEHTCWALVTEAAVSRPDLFAELSYRPHSMQPQGVPARSIGTRYVADAAEGLYTAGTVLGMFASTMTDALLAGRNVVSIQPCTVGWDMCALSRHGMIVRVGTVGALIEALEQPWHSSDASALAESVRDSCGRVEDVLAEALSWR